MIRSLAIGAAGAVAIASAALGTRPAADPPATPLAELMKDPGIKIAFLGGSITEGAGAQKSFGWAQMAAKWFQSLDRQASIRNVAIGGTSSQFANYRYGRDIGSFVPDWAFVEFADNDDPSPEFLVPYTRGLIERVRQANPRR